MHMKDLHPDVKAALVGRGLLTTDLPMEAMIGRTVLFKGPWTQERVRQMGTLARDYAFTIIGVQLNWRGEKCFRVVCQGYADTFGRPAHAEDLEFLDETEVSL